MPNPTDYERGLRNQPARMIFVNGDMPPMLVLANLCTECRFGNNCPGYQEAEAPVGAPSCDAYRPKRVSGDAMKPEHVRALPNREPCSECVSRKGTPANGTAHTKADFADCVERGVPFICNHGGDVNRVCGGWLRAAKARLNERPTDGGERDG